MILGKMYPFKQPWLREFQILFTKFIFILWSAILIYSIGPYYAILELLRNLQIFGYKKLDYEKEFHGINLRGKVCVITGGTRGIGLEVSKYLLSKNCTIITGTSNLADDANEEAIKNFKNKILSKIGDGQNVSDKFIVLPLNLSSLDSVVKFSEQIKKTNTSIDYLICNGGVMFVPFQLSHEQFESHMIINYYGHCLLTAKLLPLLVNNKSISNDRTRIIMVSSAAHYASFGLRLEDLNSRNLFSTYHGYCQSKLCQVMFTYQFHQWLQNAKLNGIELGEKISINSLHPGMCRTGLLESFNFARIKLIRDTLFFRSAAEGAETILFTTLSPKMDNISGKYLEDCSMKKSSLLSYDLDLQRQLWNRTWLDLKGWLTNDELTLLSL